MYLFHSSLWMDSESFLRRANLPTTKTLIFIEGLTPQLKMMVLAFIFGPCFSSSYPFKGIVSKFCLITGSSCCRKNCPEPKEVFALIPWPVLCTIPQLHEECSGCMRGFCMAGAFSHLYPEQSQSNTLGLAAVITLKLTSI